MTVNKGYLAGGASLLVLSLLEKEDQYGYQIIRRLEERSQKVFSLQEGTLYPVLHKLENKGYITSYEQQAPTGRMRKYYRITPEVWSFTRKRAWKKNSAGKGPCWTWESRKG